MLRVGPLAAERRGRRPCSSIAMPRWSSSFCRVRMSRTRGTRRSVSVSSVSRLAVSAGRAAFLAPLARDPAGEARRPHDVKLVHGSPSIPSITGAAAARCAGCRRSPSGPPTISRPAAAACRRTASSCPRPISTANPIPERKPAHWAKSRAKSESPAPGGKSARWGSKSQDLGGDLGDLRAVDVGRIAHHEVEAGEVEPGREVGADEEDPARRAAGRSSAATARAPGERSVATTRAPGISSARVTARMPEPVPTSRIHGRSRQPFRERHLHDVLGLRPRDEHPRVDVEGPAPEFPLPRQIGDRLAGEPPRQELPEPRFRLRRHLAPLAGDHLRLGEAEDVPEEQHGPRGVDAPNGVAARRGRASARSWPTVAIGRLV